MDQRSFEWLLYCLAEKKESLLLNLNEVESLLKNESTPNNDRVILTTEKEELLYELHEVELDTAMYEELLNKLFVSEVGACGYTCDGHCQTCGDGMYDPRYETFTGGDH